MPVYFSLLLFFALQIAAQLCFKMGAVLPRWFQPFFWGGNALGIVSIIFMVQIHKMLPPHIAIALTFGGLFVLTQLMLYLVFRAQVNWCQWGGMALILTGILITAFCVTPPKIS